MRRAVALAVVAVVFFMAVSRAHAEGRRGSKERSAVTLAQTVSDRLIVTIPLSFRTDGFVQVGDDQVRLETLAEWMREELTERPDRDAFVRADEEVTLRELVSVFDELQEGGVTNIGLLAE